MASRRVLRYRWGTENDLSHNPLSPDRVRARLLRLVLGRARGLGAGMNARHSSASNEHYTPPDIVEAARVTMGCIDLDPASCAVANEVVRAACYFDEGGLAKRWQGGTRPFRVFLNPPGGMLDGMTLEPRQKGFSSIAVWWSKLCHEYTIGNVEQAVFVCFNLEVLRTTQRKPSNPIFDQWIGHVPALAFPLCVLADRPRYWNPETPAEKRGKTGDPTHAGAVVYLPPKPSRFDETHSYALEMFRRCFSPLGYVRI